MCGACDVWPSRPASATSLVTFSESALSAPSAGSCTRGMDLGLRIQRAISPTVIAEIRRASAGSIIRLGGGRFEDVEGGVHRADVGDEVEQLSLADSAARDVEGHEIDARRGV